MKRLRNMMPSRVLPPLLAAAALAGCATTEMTAQSARVKVVVLSVLQPMFEY